MLGALCSRPAGFCFVLFLLFCSGGAVRKKDLQEMGGKMASGEREGKEP